MPLSSMTGFARSSGEHQGLYWQWEIKSVNGKALDVRLRLPPGFEALETPVRSALAQPSGAAIFRFRSASAVPFSAKPCASTRCSRPAGGGGRSAPRKDRRRTSEGRCSARDQGVVEVTSLPEEEDQIERRHAAMLESFGEALRALAAARLEEGARLQAILSGQVTRIAELTAGARQSRPLRRSDPRAACRAGVPPLETGALDPDRLHQEAVLIATRADIQEELDRLALACRGGPPLLAASEAIGRKFDFLAQEFNREANTLCSKAVRPHADA
jgi:uncharacterized protein YicC (UPF0701 family)